MNRVFDSLVFKTFLKASNYFRECNYDISCCLIS